MEDLVGEYEASLNTTDLMVNNGMNEHSVLQCMHSRDASLEWICMRTHAHTCMHIQTHTHTHACTRTHGHALTTR